MHTLASSANGRSNRHGRALTPIAVMTALVALTPLAGCGSSSTDEKATTDSTAAAPTSWADVEAAAKKEGTVTFYTLGDDIVTAMTKGFQQAYPWAKVKAVVGSPDITSRVVTETRTGAGTADVIMLPQGQRKALLSVDAVQKAEVPNDAAMPDAFKDPTGLAHPVYVTPIVLAYNTKLLKPEEVPTTLSELADPKWKGKLAFDRPQNQTISASVLVSQKNPMGEEKWNEWMQGVADNQVFLAPDATSAYQAVLRGEAQIAVDTPNDVLAQAKGTPMANAFYENIVPFVQYVWLTKRSGHPNIGKLFINWLLSPEGQQVWEQTGRSPALESVEGEATLKAIVPPQYKFAPVSDLSDFFENPTPYLDKFNSLWPN